MSAILAGEKCKKCGEKFYVSWHNPDWFKNKENKTFKLFQEMRASGLCPQCYFKTLVEQLEDVCALLGIDMEVDFEELPE